MGLLLELASCEGDSGLLMTLDPCSFPVSERRKAASESLKEGGIKRLRRSLLLPCLEGPGEDGETPDCPSLPSAVTMAARWRRRLRLPAPGHEAEACRS